MRTRIIAVIALLAICGITKAQNCGCNDPMATNYDSTATTNDGSCIYPNSSITPQTIGQLPPTLNGTSSLIFWDGGYWSCNDHTKLQLYRIDTLTGAITDSLLVSEAAPKDMEEIAQDSDYLYFGDFGNNANTRKDLHILRVGKTSLKNGNPIIDTIFFSYPDQTDFTSSSMETDFDCEAFVAGNDKIYIFTKQWSKLGTTCYELPKLPGTYVAVKLDSCNVQGLVTGATLFENSNLVVLCGYSTLLQPFIYLLYDYTDGNFFNGNKRKISINLLGSQIEAIAGPTPTDYYLTNEKFTIASSSIPASLHRISVSDYLTNYLYGTPPTNIDDNGFRKEFYDIKVFPNPASEKLFISDPNRIVRSIGIYTPNGKQVIHSLTEHTDTHCININQIKEGVYFLVMKMTDGRFVKEKIVVK